MRIFHPMSDVVKPHPPGTLGAEMARRETARAKKLAAPDGDPCTLRVKPARAERLITVALVIVLVAAFAIVFTGPLRSLL